MVFCTRPRLCVWLFYLKPSVTNFNTFIALCNHSSAGQPAVWMSGGRGGGGRVVDELQLFPTRWDAPDWRRRLTDLDMSFLWGHVGHPGRPGMRGKAEKLPETIEWLIQVPQLQPLRRLALISERGGGWSKIGVTIWLTLPMLLP